MLNIRELVINACVDELQTGFVQLYGHDESDYLRKIPALFYEFEEIGMNQTFGYRSPGSIRQHYGGFFSHTVMRFTSVTPCTICKRLRKVNSG